MSHVALAIVGGGPAGLTTAIAALARDPSLRGRLVVLEKEHYPREKICAGGIGARADRLLETLGVRVRVPEVVIDGVTARFGAGTVRVNEPAMGRIIRRAEFDEELARQARQRGVTIVEGARVDRIEFDRDGVSLATGAGAFHADVVVGADGVGSVVRRAMEIPFGRLRAQVVEVDTEPVSSDLERSRIAFDLCDRSYRGYAWDFPTVVAGKPMVCRGAYVLELSSPERTLRDGKGRRQRSADPREVLERHLDERGLALGNYRQKRFAERALDWRLPLSRRRVLLTGEAAGIEALLGEGIAHAIHYGALAGRYVADRLARGEVDFRSWRARVMATTRLGLDMNARALIAAAFYGPARSEMERFMVRTPAFLRSGARYFAGKRYKAELASSLATLAKDAAWGALSAGATTSAWQAAAPEPSSNRT